MIKVNLTKSDRICQGDLIKNVEYIEYASEKEATIEISKIVFPVVIVLTQDCDLEQDHKNRNQPNANQDKHLISIIVAPVYNLEHIYDGNHLSEIGLKMQSINKDSNKTENKFLKQNKNPRYHFLQFDDSVTLVDSIIDFKHYFTVNINYISKLKETNFICKIEELYREQISQRFAYFLSRIGLPNN